MAWLAVDKNEDEYIYECKPVRERERDKWLPIFLTNLIQLPQGTIAKLLRHDMKWEDEPIEFK